MMKLKSQGRSRVVPSSFRKTGTSGERIAQSVDSGLWVLAVRLIHRIVQTVSDRER